MRTKHRSLRLAKTLGIAASSVIGSLILALIFEPFLGDTAHFLPFTLAVIISSWCGGLIFGLGATVASLLIVDYFFMVPVHRLLPIQPHALALLVLTLVVGVLISVLQSTLARANRALRKSREQVELAAEAGRIGFSESFNEDQVAWTPEMEKLFGLTPGSFEGTLSDWLKRIHPDDRAAFQRERHRQIEQRQPELKFDYRAVLPNGEVRWLEGRRRLILSKTGEVERIVSASIDITDRHELEQALTARTEELNHSNQELERFAYTVAHDLQSPLRNVEALTQLFLKRTRRELDLESTNLLELVVGSADRMRRLIQHMLELAHARHAPKKEEAVDMAMLARLAADQMGAVAADAVISIGALPIVQGDENEILRLFENLIGNAVKFRSDRQPEVHVDASLEAGEWVFSVRDNGIGIDPADHGRIFEEFQRLHSVSRYEGSGIGLSVCRRIVQRHQGRIWVESTPGEGATFRFTIPQTPAATRPPDSQEGVTRNRAAAG